jgi:hypothetical protein
VYITTTVVQYGWYTGRSSNASNGRQRGVRDNYTSFLYGEYWGFLRFSVRLGRVGFQSIPQNSLPRGPAVGYRHRGDSHGLLAVCHRLKTVTAQDIVDKSEQLDRKPRTYKRSSADSLSGKVEAFTMYVTTLERGMYVGLNQRGAG